MTVIIQNTTYHDGLTFLGLFIIDEGLNWVSISTTYTCEIATPSVGWNGILKKFILVCQKGKESMCFSHLVEMSTVSIRLSMDAQIQMTPPHQSHTKKSHKIGSKVTSAFFV